MNREKKPALIGDQVDADIARLRELAIKAWPSEVITYEIAEFLAQVATRYEVISSAYFATYTSNQKVDAAGGEVKE